VNGTRGSDGTDGRAGEGNHAQTLRVVCAAAKPAMCQARQKRMPLVLLHSDGGGNGVLLG